MIEHSNEVVREPWSLLLRGTRMLSGKTRAAVAEDIGVTADTVGRWERGENQIRASSRTKIASLLELSDELAAEFGLTGHLSESITQPDVDVRKQVLGSFVTRIEQGPALSEPEASILRELLGLPAVAETASV